MRYLAVLLICSCLPENPDFVRPQIEKTSQPEDTSREDTKPIEEPPDNSCDDEPEGKRITGSGSNVGDCQPFIKVCHEGRWLFEQLEVQPMAEICDARDNDCDGSTDELLQMGECLPFDEALCEGYYFSCLDGKVACLPIPGPFIEICNNGIDEDCNGMDLPCQGTEVCNGIDDNNNGEIDEQIETAIPCYSGPPNTQGVGECRSGLHLCLNGELDVSKCLFETTPRVESCIPPGLDEDCDGLVDEHMTHNVNDNMDVVVILDISGSMNTYESDIISSLSGFADQFISDSTVRFTLVLVGLTAAPNYQITCNSQDAAVFKSMLINSSSYDGSSEPTYDVLHMAVDPANPLGINWISGASKLMMMFTDEPAQSTTGLTEMDVAVAVQSSDAIVFLYVSATEDFDSIPSNPDHVKDLLEPNLADTITNSFLEACY